MNTLAQLNGTYVLDATHTQIGFAARHAMVTKVRGQFGEFEGTASTGANLADARIDVTIQTASVDTGNGDRDGHLRSGDFFDVETYPTIRFTSTRVTNPSPEVLRVDGDLTIKDATRPVTIDFEFEGSALDPFGNERVGLSGEVVVNRKDFGLTWNAALETGGVLVSENVTLTFEVSAIKAVDAAAVAEPVVDEAPAVEAAATASDPVVEATPAPAQGVLGWIKKLFAPAAR